MRSIKTLFLLTALAVGLVATGISPAAQQDPTEPAPYWKLRGCNLPGPKPAHGHPSKLARQKIRQTMQNHTPYTKAEGQSVRHFTYCVRTRAKARAGEKLVVQLKAWRRANVCTVSRGNVALGRCMAVRDYGWTGGQFSCLYSLWDRESGWSTWAHNGSSGAHGIPQALPGWKMGSGWESDPVVQIRWGLGYIRGRYGTPCGAWGHFVSANWY